ncbi:MAG: site-specific integrase [Aulosira sp. DedQUE10]|nr:site-specific integrase [Aulosira sp. DedQUE10]
MAEFVNLYLLGGEVEVISKKVREIVSKHSPRTVNQAVTAIQGLDEFHAIEGKIDEKRFTQLTRGWAKRGGFLRGIVKSTPEKRKRIKIKEPKIFPGCLTDVEVRQLADACCTYRDRLIVMLLRETGVQRGKLLGLHLLDVQDFDITRRIRIVRCENNTNGAIARSLMKQSIQAILLEKMGPVFVIRKESRDAYGAAYSCGEASYA